MWTLWDGEAAGRGRGLVGGSSSGAAVFAAVELAQELGAGKRIAVIIPDSAERYLSKKIFEGGV
jgi:cysteine synthase